MSIPLQIRSYGDREYVMGLRQAYLGMQLWEPSVALSEDSDIDEKMLRDIHIAAMWSKRVRKVAGRRFEVEATGDTDEEKAVAEIVNAAIERIDNFTQARQELASSGIWGGRGYQFVASRRMKTSLAGKADEWLVPIRLDDIDAARIRFDPVWEQGPDGKRTLRTVAKFWPIELGSEPVEISRDDARALVHVTFGDEERRLGYGRGLRDALYFAFYAKVQLVQKGLRAAARWAEGLTIAKIDPDAHGGTAQTNAAIAQDFLTTLKKTRAEHVLAIDKRDEVDVLWPSGEGWRMFMEGIRYWDDRISALLVASVLPTGGGEDVGSNARAETEAGSEDELIAGDRDVLDGAWSRCLIRDWFMHFNRQAIARAGYKGLAAPRFRTGSAETTDPQVKIDAVRAAVEMGAPVSADEFYAALGLQKPDSAPPVIRQQQAQAPPGGGAPQSPFRFQEQAVAMLENKWDEEKHPRDGGKFAPKEGDGDREGEDEGGDVSRPTMHVASNSPPELVSAVEQYAKDRDLDVNCSEETEGQCYDVARDFAGYVEDLGLKDENGNDLEVEAWDEQLWDKPEELADNEYADGHFVTHVKIGDEHWMVDLTASQFEEELGWKGPRISDAFDWELP